MATLAADWTEGYVAEIEYTSGFYQELAPNLLSFAALVAGYQAPAIDRPFTCFELGCGKGISANLIAAANPAGRFYANDFNPAHIVFARGLAADARLENVTFLEKSFAELGGEELPDFDYITLHGVYSWVSAENRRAIVDFIRRKLKPGGLVYISYNSLPGWSAFAPLRELMMQYAARQTGPLPQRIKSSLAFAQGLGQAKAKYFAGNPAAGPRLDRMAGQATNYLAHEYFNKDWTLLYHADVVADMTAAKLTYAGSASIIEQFDDVVAKPEALALYKDINDRVLRETVKDFVLNQQFRRDIYVRGAPRLDVRAQIAAAMKTRLVLRVPRAQCSETVKVPVGTINLAPAYMKMLDFLADGPQSLRDILAKSEIVKLGDATQAIRSAALLTAVGYIAPALPEEAEKAARQSTRQFNDAIVNRTMRGDDISYFASPVTGNGVAADAADRLFVAAERQNRKDPEEFAWQNLSKRGQGLAKDGKALKTPEENKAELARLAKAFAGKKLPVYRSFGIV